LGDKSPKRVVVSNVDRPVFVGLSIAWLPKCSMRRRCSSQTLLSAGAALACGHASAGRRGGWSKIFAGSRQLFLEMNRQGQGLEGEQSF
jgi:hypothetical protein